MNRARPSAKQSPKGQGGALPYAPSSRRRRVSVASFSVLFVVLTVLLLYRAVSTCGQYRLALFMDRLPVMTSAVNQLRVGMSECEVRTILGDPPAIWDDGTWVYFRDDAWTVFYVRFDEGRQLRDYRYDN